MSETPIYEELRAEHAHSSDELDELIARIRASLSDDLLKADQRRRERRTASAGHCYVASETLWHLSGCTLSVCQVEHENNSHWFLRDEQTGAIYDPTADQFATPPPYASARRRAFLTRQPSKRAAILISRVERL